MHSSVTERYLETEVMTAPPQKLHLMLIEGAIRTTQKGKELMLADEHEEACETLIRAQRIVTEMLTGLNRDADAALARKFAAVYLFVFRSLMEANARRNPDKLDDALRVLRVERETWRQVCGASASERDTAVPARVDRPTDIPRSPMSPGASPDSDAMGEMPSGFSLEA